MKYTDRLRRIAAELKTMAREMPEPGRTELIFLADATIANAHELDVEVVPVYEDLN